MPSTGPLRAEAYPDATIVPFTKFTRKNGRPALRMGVFDARGRVVPASLLTRSFGKVGFAPEFSADTRAAARRDPRTVVFGGRLSRHFGHFLLESLAKAWYARQHPQLPLAWAWPADRPDPGYSPWQAVVLEVLGVTNEPIFVAQPTRFEQVVVPDSGYRIKDFIAPEQAAFLAAYPAQPRDPDLRVWLSRSRVDPGVLHAQRLEAELAAAGWTVAYPEALTPAQQLTLLATASRVAGDEGSAFHLLALLVDVHGLRVDIFCRYPDRTVEQQNANYQTIADARGLDQHMHVMADEMLLEVRSTKVTKLATTLAGYREVLDLPPLPGPPASSLTAQALARELAGTSGASSYLEVTERAPLGVDLEVPVREVVGEVLGFDPRDRLIDGLVSYELPPSDYFEHLASAERDFDLIVLAGSPAALTDWIERARSQARSDTVWLISAEPAMVPPSLGSTRRVADGGEVWTIVGGPAGDEA